MKLFRRFRDDRFALTTLQNPTIEVRTYADLVQTAQQGRQNHPPPRKSPQRKCRPPRFQSVVIHY
jgi:hypothetical protein